MARGQPGAPSAVPVGLRKQRAQRRAVLVLHRRREIAPVPEDEGTAELDALSEDELLRLLGEELER